MSQNKLPQPHPHAHSHAHLHLHLHHSAPQEITRRQALKAGLSLAGSGLLAKMLQKLHLLPGGTAVAQATDPKHIYLAPDDHTDYIWSAGEAAYRQAFVDMLDWYLDQADEDINNGTPLPYHSRWNCDGYYWAWVYAQEKNSGEFTRLIERIRDGHITLPLNALCVCEGGAPMEAILRGMYYPGRLERRYGLRFSLAYAMENQTLPYGLGALWAGAGAKYSWKGICGCATHVPDAWDREHEVYWWEGADGSRILMKWNSMLYGNQSIGGYAEARDPSGVVELVDSDPGFLARYLYRIIGAFGYGWDDVQTLLSRSQFVNVAINKTNADRQVYVSNMQDFFEDFEAQYEQELPVVSCSFGNEWDLDCAVMAEVSARAKRAVEKLRCAEALAALVSIKEPTFLDGRQAARDRAFVNLGLFWEHDWAGAPSYELTQERISWQKRITGEIESYVDQLYVDGLAGLGAMIPAGEFPRYFVFNPLSWARSEAADLPYDSVNPVHVVDLASGDEIPSQPVTVDGQAYLRVLATDVPAMGYRVVEVRPGSGADFSSGAPTVAGSTLENEFYQVTVDSRGAITSLVDKNRGGREFVQTGGALNDLGPGAGNLQVENSGVVSVTLRAAVSASDPLAHTTRVTLVRGVDGVLIENVITQNFDQVYTWNFGFNLSSPEVWHEELGAILLAKKTIEGGHYSPRNARYDWLTLNHFADMSGVGVGVTLANADCYFVKIGNSTVSTLDTSTPRLTVLAGGGVNGGNAIRNQGGADQDHFLQRFALQTHDQFAAVPAMKFALEHQNPLAVGPVTGGSRYPAGVYSWLSIDHPQVLLWALKPAEDGLNHGLIARLWNLGSTTASFTLQFENGPMPVAQHVTHIETPLAPANLTNGALAETIGAHQVKSFLLGLPGISPELNQEFYLPLVNNALPGAE